MSSTSLKSCEICGKKFSSIKALKIHSLCHKSTDEDDRISLSPDEFGRPRNNRSVQSNNDLLDEEDSEAEAECTFCGKSFSNDAILLRHQQREHRDDVEELRSEEKRQRKPTAKLLEATKGTGDIKELRQKIGYGHDDYIPTTVAGEFLCPVCGMQFETYRGMVAHRTHKHKRAENSSKEKTKPRKPPVRTSYGNRFEEYDDEDEIETIDYKKQPLRRPIKLEPPDEIIAPPSSFSAERAKRVGSLQPAPPGSQVGGSALGFDQEEEDYEDRTNNQSTSRHYYSSSATAPSAQQDSLEPTENFPCKFCEDRVFLTSFGLERHTQATHAEHIDEVLEDIKRAKDEKIRRIEAKRSIIGPGINEGFREAVGALDRIEKLKQFKKEHTGKENIPDVDEDMGALTQMARQQRDEIVSAAKFTHYRTFSKKSKYAKKKAKYQSCETCGILINTEHPLALESHMKAHEKNDELKASLLEQYGQAWVEQVTCRECNLVFKDDEKLERHRKNVHVRRRHFLCRFCGDVFRNMRDLNLHKERRHDAFEGHRRHPDAVELDNFRRAVAHADLRPVYENDDDQPQVGDAGNGEEFSCRTSCEVCGVPMVRPSNLVRHMKNTHDRFDFTATIDTRGLPPFRVDVNQGRFLWGCCDHIYEDRRVFIKHRRTAHGPQAFASLSRECSHCGMMFRNNLLFINHMRTHMPQTCHVCGKVFATSTALQSSEYRAHMLQHKERGFVVDLGHIRDDMARKGVDPEMDALTRMREAELNKEDDELDDAGCSGDEYSIFSGSGVESECDDVQSIVDERDQQKSMVTCPICDKYFDCVHRFANHWTLHCKNPKLKTDQLKTHPFSYTTSSSSNLRFKCSECRLHFASRAGLAVHYLRCRRLTQFGILPKCMKLHRPDDIEEDEETDCCEATVKNTIQDDPPAQNFNLDANFPAIRSPVMIRVGSDRSMASEARRELEDCLDVSPVRQRIVANRAERAFLVAWDTDKATSLLTEENVDKSRSEGIFNCTKCDFKAGEILALVEHLRKHCAKSIEGANMGAQPGNELALKNGEGAAKAFVIGIGIRDAKNRFVCKFCSKRFANEELLSEHNHLHHENNRTVRCDVCGKAFWSSSGLRNHLMRHDTTKFFCNNCNKCFRTYETLTKHQTVHELTFSVYQCEDCVLSLYGLKQLKKHFADSHPGINIVSCPVCARIHTDTQGLLEHFCTEHAATRSKCGVCFKYFATPMKVKAHVDRTHRRFRLMGGRQKCKVCDKQFLNMQKLSVHLWRHRTGKHFQCGKCCWMARSADAIRFHLESRHGVHWSQAADLIVENSRAALPVFQ